MNYIELSSKYKLSSIDELQELLFKHELTRAERIEAIRKLRWAYRYMRNSMFRIMKLAANDKLLELIFEQECVPKSILRNRDKYEFRRLTRFEFVYKFIECYKIDKENAFWFVNEPDDCVSDSYFGFIFHLFHMVNHISLRKIIDSETFDFGHFNLDSYFDFCKDDEDDEDYDEFEEFDKLYNKIRAETTGELIRLSKRGKLNIPGTNADEYLDLKFKQIIKEYEKRIPNINRLIELTKRQPNNSEKSMKFKEELKRLKNWHELVIDNFSASFLGCGCSTFEFGHYSSHPIDKFRCICSDDNRYCTIHYNSYHMALEVYKLIKIDGMELIGWKHSDSFYKGDTDFVSPFFYGDEYLFELCNHDEGLIKRYLYDYMYSKIASLIKK